MALLPVSAKRMISSIGVQPTYVVLLLFILTHEKSVDPKIVQGPSNTTAMVNELTYLNCSTSVRPVDERSISWFHYPLDAGGDRKYVYDDGRIMTNYRNRFDIDRDMSSGTFNLLALRLEPKDAGRYECRDDIQEGQGASAELTVLESDLVCESDVESGGVIGPTQCDRAIEPEEVQLSCRVKYNGKHAPQMTWRKSGGSSTSTKTECLTKDNRVTCNTTLTANLQLNGSVYYCEFTAQQYNCPLEINNILYVFTNSKQREYHTGNEVTCVANASRQLPCSYQWYKENSTEAFSHETLKPKDRGLYRCQAECAVRNDTCKFTAMVINVSTVSDPGSNLLYYLWFLLLILIILGVILAIRYKRIWLRLSENRRNYKEDPDLVKIIRTKGAENLRKGISGLAIADTDLIITTFHINTIEVYNLKSLTLACSWILDPLKNPWDLGYCNANKCLYVMDTKLFIDVQKEILIVDRSGKLKTSWTTNGMSYGCISVTYDCNILVAEYKGNRITEYTPDGQTVFEINLSTSRGFVHPRHAIKLTDGRYLMSHGEGEDPLHQVCVVDTIGDIQMCFGGERGSISDRLFVPIYLAIDPNGSIFVVDRDNSRVLLLSSDLQFASEIISRKKEEMHRPERLVIDQANGRMLVAHNDDCWSECRVFAFEIQ